MVEEKCHVTFDGIYERRHNTVPISSDASKPSSLDWNTCPSYCTGNIEQINHSLSLIYHEEWQPVLFRPSLICFFHKRTTNKGSKHTSYYMVLRSVPIFLFSLCRYIPPGVPHSAKHQNRGELKTRTHTHIISPSSNLMLHKIHIEGCIEITVLPIGTPVQIIIIVMALLHTQRRHTVKEEWRGRDHAQRRVNADA